MQADAINPGRSLEACPDPPLGLFHMNPPSSAFAAAFLMDGMGFTKPG